MNKKWDISGTFATAIRLGIWFGLSVMTGYAIMNAAVFVLKVVAMRFGVLEYFLIPGTDKVEGDAFILLFLFVTIAASDFYKSLILWCGRHIKVSIRFVK